MSSSIAKINAFDKKFGAQHVLSKLDWQIEAGGLLGSNGADKSTLLEWLPGLREADAGSGTIYGESAVFAIDNGNTLEDLFIEVTQ
jgi:ABC-type sugar transport system ATPase subunit